MKLILAIVNNDDSAYASASLTEEGFFVTKLSTTGGFLMVGNTTFLIGTHGSVKRYGRNWRMALTSWMCR